MVKIADIPFWLLIKTLIQNYWMNISGPSLAWCIYILCSSYHPWCTSGIRLGSRSCLNLHIASFATEHGVCQQQNARDTQLYVSISPASLHSNHCQTSSLSFSLQTWSLHNGLSLNPDKTEAIFALALPVGSRL